MQQNPEDNNDQAPAPPPLPPQFKPVNSETPGAQETPPYVIQQMPAKDSGASQGQPADQQQTPQVVYVARPLEPEKPQISEEAKKRHEDSKKKYPNLNLSEGEYIVRDVKRHMIGLVQIWAAVGVLVLMSFAFLGFMSSGANVLNGTEGNTGIDGSVIGFGLIVLLLLNALFVLGGLIATKVYLGNRFYLTNESVIQVIQHSLFSKREQTVSLANVEDASFLQTGIMQHVLNYGSIRLSTEGEETTYRYNYVSNPGTQVGILNNAVESFKNGRPVDARDD